MRFKCSHCEGRGVRSQNRLFAPSARPEHAKKPNCAYCLGSGTLSQRKIIDDLSHCWLSKSAAMRELSERAMKPLTVDQLQAMMCGYIEARK